MNGVGRLVGRKDKDGSSHKRDKSREIKVGEKSTAKKTRSMSDVFTSIFRDSNRKASKSEKEEHEEREKVASLRRFFQNEGRNDVNDEQIIFCLNSKFAKGDAEKARLFLVVIQESLSGIVYPFDPLTNMLGAENPTATCWLDSFLCSLFSVPTQFQDLLIVSYEDPSKQKLIQLIRLWVNLLRKGILIEVSITDRILDSLHECGWDDLDRTKHQDPTEAHMKIGDILNWPMLKLRVDLQHGGIESTQDDHKTSQERTVPVSIPTNYSGLGRVTLEECIEDSLNSHVQVCRCIEPSPPESTRNYDEKPILEHVEITEAESTIAPPSPLEIVTQTHSQNQLVREITHERKSLYRSMSRISTRSKGIGREVTIPALQAYTLFLRPYPNLYHLNSNITQPKIVPILIDNIAWSATDPPPISNQELAHRFHKHKPMIGFDLKRYGVGSDGISTVRINTPVDIPSEMRIPYFVDEGVSHDVPISERYKLVLRSMICHKGDTIHSGHYTSVFRLNLEADGDWDSERPNDSGEPPEYAEERWMVHDDIADKRVQRADINAALNDDEYGMPVTLWYELVPTYEEFRYEELHRRTSMDNMTPPSYTEVSSIPSIDVQVPNASLDLNNGHCNYEGYLASPPKDNPTSTVRFSSEIDRQRASLNLLDEDRRGSVAVTDASSLSAEKSDGESAPVSPGEESTSNRLSRTFRRSKTSLSRPTSTSNENRNTFGYFKGKVSSKTSKESLHKPDKTKESIPAIPTIPGLDGFSDSHINGESTKTIEANGKMSRQGSKKGKRRAQSKGATEMEAKDRVCNIM
ncbi:hypothetical protein NHQ30_000412 [Ciborinia camelliae]|nr:hypothetical protein NHQ30_000412 [Ciborinia camelliae]